MSSPFDVVVGGGSVGGLSFAAEASRRGLRVLVLEEDKEVGEPEKCDGLVSLKELRRYFAPSADSIQSYVSKGIVHSPSGKSVVLDATRLEVVVIDRSQYDKQLAERAEAWGAEVKTGCRVREVLDRANSVKVAADEVYQASLYVDATGPSSAIGRNRAGLLPAAKYEIEGEWFKDGQVEVFTDTELYPGFFAWVIPRGSGMAKVGVAGLGINSFKALDAFLAGRRQTIVRRVAAPIYVGGTIGEFVSGRTVYVGESAGQVKPTTAGGITTSVAAGVISARWAADSILLKDPKLLNNYQPDWESRFAREFTAMKRLRRLFEYLSNKDLENIMSLLSSKKVSERLSSSEFDFHASGLISALGVKGMLKLAQVLVSVEAKQAISSLR